MNSQSLKAHPKKQSEAEQQIKLSNGIAISICLLILLAFGWYFESQLSMLEQQSVTVTIESSTNELFESDSQQMIELVDNEKTNKLARLLAIELLDTSLTLQAINQLPLLFQLNELESKSVLVLAIKLMLARKHFAEAITVLNKINLQERLALGLQFSKAFAESKLDLQESVISYEKLLKKQPRHQSAIINLALLYLDELQPVKAEDLLRQHVESMSGVKKAKAYAALARSLDQQNKFDLSQTYYLKSIEYRPSHSQTWGHLATAKAKQFKQHASIRDSFEKAIALDRKNLSLKMKYSFYLIKKMDYSLAVVQLKQARKLGRDRFNIRLWLAFCYSQIGKPVNAKKQLSIALKNTERVSNKTKVAAFHRYLEADFSKSIELFKTLLKKNRDNDFEYLMIALGYSELNKRKSAKVYLDKLTPSSLLFMRANLLLAENYAKAKQYQDSLLVFNQIVESIDDNWAIYLKISETAVKANNDQVAISAIDQALFLNDDKKIQRQKSEILWRLGRQLDAIIVLESLVAAKPNYLRAIYQLADYNLQIGKYKESQRLFLQLLADHPDYLDVQYRLAIDYVKLTQWNDAVALLKEYLERKSDSKKARLLYARVFCETGQSVKCKEQLQLLIKLDRQYKPAIDYAQSVGIKIDRTD